MTWFDVFNAVGCITIGWGMNSIIHTFKMKTRHVFRWKEFMQPTPHESNVWIQNIVEDNRRLRQVLKEHGIDA